MITKCGQKGPWYYMLFVSWRTLGLGVSLSTMGRGYYYLRIVLGPIDLEVGRDEDTNVVQ